MNATVGYKNNSQFITVVGIPLFIICIYVVGVNVALTQWIAMNFGFHSSLGDPIYREYYLPWYWMDWTMRFSPAYQTFFQKVFFLVVGAFMGLLLLGMFFLVRSRKVTTGNISLHGTAHFATDAEIKKSGIYKQDEGVYVGGYQKTALSPKEYLRHNGKEHIFAFAPTRAGKGVGLILPTLLSWLGSVFVLDIKGENFALSAGWRKLIGQHIIKFQPNCNDGTGSRFNPFAEVRLDTDFAYADTENIINIVAAADAGDKIDPHFEPLAKTFLTACAIHWLYEYDSHNERLSLPDLNTEISSDNVDGYLEEMVEAAHTDASANVAKQMIERRKNSPKEAGGIISTSQKYLRLYNDPVVAKNVQVSDFKITDLMRNDKPVSFYLVIPPNQIDRFAPLTRMIVDTIINRLASEMEFSGGNVEINYKHRLLLMLDEFPAFGRLHGFEKALAFIAGYGIKAYIICQDKIQLCKQNAYGREQAITTGCHVHIAYPPNDPETAEKISKMTGETTVIKKKITTSGKRSSVYAKNMSISREEVKRPLLTPDEVSRLDGPEKDANGNITKAGEMLVFQTGKPPIRGRQILFFEDPIFLARAKVPPPERGDIIES